MATPQVGGIGLCLKQYSKDVPPGWRPPSYPFKEYLDYLNIWSALARLYPQQMGPATLSRLEEGPLRLGLAFQLERINETTLLRETFVGVDAVQLPKRDAWVDAHGGPHAAELSGVRTLIRKLQDAYEMDDQDLVWTSLDKFFMYRQPHGTDFTSYYLE